MSKNFDELPAASALGGTETLPINQSGVTKKTTISAIATFVGSGYEVTGAAAAAVNNHLSAYDHTAFAPLASPVLTGTPQAPTPTSTDNTTRIATTAFVKEQFVLPTFVNGITCEKIKMHSASLGGTNYNIGIGAGTFSIPNSLTGENNIGVGYYALNACASGGANVAVGYNTLKSVTTGSSNTALGSQALSFCTSGIYNVAVGAQCLMGVTTGTYNIAMGYQAGETTNSANKTTIASYQIFIGANAGASVASATALTNSIAIGQEATIGISDGWTIGKLGTIQCIKEGTNAAMGVATLVGGTVTVSNTKVKANSRIFLTPQTSGGTRGAVGISARTVGTSFTITSTSATDTSVIAWEIKEPA